MTRVATEPAEPGTATVLDEHSLLSLTEVSRELDSSYRGLQEQVPR